MKTTGEQTKRKKTEKELSGGCVLRNIQRVTGVENVRVWGEKRRKQLQKMDRAVETVE